jgi:hypothetical protein
MIEEKLTGERNKKLHPSGRSTGIEFGDLPFGHWVNFAVLAWSNNIVLVLSETVLVLVIESRQS